MKQIFWLRSETKKNEFRRALTPDACTELIKFGHKVIVEDWKDSIIPISNYKDVGCEIVSERSWINAPKETVIVGLKALPDDVDIFIHRHIFFAHVYKEQDGWKEIMQKFKKGGGEIIDLEFMVDENKRRVCAFGYWAGYVGAALGALFSKAKNFDLAKEELAKKMRFPDKQALISFVTSHCELSQSLSTKLSHEAIIIGCSGRSGHGATDCLEELGWSTTGWDKNDTQRGGPFSEILNYDLFVNCVLAMQKMEPFITMDLVKKSGRKLNMISDVSCDPDSDCNMVPLYEVATLIGNPVFDVVPKTEDHNNWLGLVAIDNLPSILPKESSFDFSSQLVTHLLKDELNSLPVKNALDTFSNCMENL